MTRYTILIFLAITLFSCKKEATQFSNPTPQETGITFENALTESDDLNILDYLYFYNGGGVAVGDINGDTLPDIYLSGNQVKNKLYLNKGNFKFEDITEQAGVAGNSTWNTGAVMGDVNGDGLLDIYVCAVVGINGFYGQNELFINNGDSTFTESAAKYGLDLDSSSSNAAFLDYDLDGDLDIYILNHAVHTQKSFGKADLRYERNYQTGDKLMRNDGDTFTDVSEEAGIYGGINSYGLGISIADFNQDGFPDIYVGNDFHEDDYYYLNTGDGRFRESLKEYFGHTSRFSMGNDAADINGDAWPDLISLDMLAEDEKVIKSSEGDDNIQTQKLRTERYGYHYQYTRNMLFVNQQGYDFTENALQSGIAATDWSWSALFADFDHDARQDLFISNGIPKRPNNLDYINFISSDQIQDKISNTKLIDQKALDLMPSGTTHNYVFKGADDLRFTNKSGSWTKKDTLVSGATAIADFDQDGDLDIITTVINDGPLMYKNLNDNTASSYLKIKPSFKKPNQLGIGTKALVYTNGATQYKELYTVRGFQASSEPIIHFGFPKGTRIDSLRIIWPDNTSQILKDITLNQTLEVSPKNTVAFNYGTLKQKNEALFIKTPNNLGLNFTHQEDRYLDFNRQKLIPYQVSDRGPATAVGDMNGDGLDDVFFGSSKFNEAQIYFQSGKLTKDSLPSAFTKPTIPAFLDKANEETASALADFNGDSLNDLILGTGGADFSGKSSRLLDSFYIQQDSTFVSQAIPEMYQNASTIATGDYDNDGDLDVFIGNQSITGDFGAPSTSFLLQNTNGDFTIAQPELFENLGMLTDAIWSDYDGDGDQDLIVVGEWMTPLFFENNQGTLSRKRMLSEKLTGLWQTIQPFDIDGDGDLDYLLGNWGENSKFVASEEFPLRMYYSDFDTNGNTETIIATAKNGKYYPLAGLDELASQLVVLKKKYGTYNSFAGQTIDEILDPEMRRNSTVLNVHTLSSGYLKNNKGSFEFMPFSGIMQVAPILSFVTHDFDKDGKDEVLAAGNYFGVKPYHGRLDSFSGALIKDENTTILAHNLGLDLAQLSARSLDIVTIKNVPYLLVTFNNAPAQLYTLKDN